MNCIVMGLAVIETRQLWKQLVAGMSHGPLPGEAIRVALITSRHLGELGEVEGVRSVIWLGCTSHCCANPAGVFPPLKAAKATFGLNPAVWFLRGRPLI